jgi:hypothetical protein
MLSLLLALLIHDTPIEAKLVRVNKIWDSSPHAAFTDLIYWKNQFVCVFRTGKGHVSPDGTLQLLHSSDGSTWKPLATVTSKTADLRDPKLAIGMNDELLLYAAAAVHDKSKFTHQTMVWRSSDGITWSEPAPIGEPNSWLWRVTRQPNGGYLSWGYDCSKERFIELYQSKNGTDFTRHTPMLLTDQGYPNETAMVMEGDKAWCLLRRDGNPPLDKGMLGTSTAPFTNWTWRELDQKIGGPAMLRLPGGQFLAVVRLYSVGVPPLGGKAESRNPAKAGTPAPRTVLCQLDPQKPELKELLTFPSGGDCSYAGMVWHQSKLFVSYYSSHEGKSSIYFAEVEIKQE